MKVLNFTEENKEVYDVIFEAVRAYPVKGIEEIIKAATIIEKLKEIGVEKGEQVQGFVAYKLKAVPTTIELEDDHFKYIKTVFDATPWSTSVKIELLAMAAKFLKQADG
jgi:hypothetical protein